MTIDDINVIRSKVLDHYKFHCNKDDQKYTVLNKLDRIMLECMILAKIAYARSLDIYFKCEVEKIFIDENIDEYYLCEIVSCLLDNAIESGSKKIILNIYESNNESIIEVKNEHKTITFNSIENMFKKGFSTKNNNQKDHIKGYGLYNVKKIIEKYDIEINVFNELMHGSNYIVFRVTCKRQLKGALLN